MNSGYWQAVEREARALRDAMLADRTASFVSSDTKYRRDVKRRLVQLLSGDETPPAGDPNDD